MAIQQLLVTYGVPPTPLWTPADLTVPPSIWLNDTSNISVTGSDLVQWDDISGNAIHFAAVGGPDVIASGLDGKRTILFDGSNGIANTGATAKALTNGIAAAWVMMLFKNSYAGAASLRHAAYISTNATNTVRFSYASDTTTATRRPAARMRRADGDAAAVLNASAAIDTNWHGHLCLMDYANRDCTINIDGTQDAQNLTFTSAGATTSATNSLDGIAFAGTTTSPSAHIEVAEIILGLTLPSGAEIEMLEGYLFHKWGLEALLPALHTYKSAPP